MTAAPMRGRVAGLYAITPDSEDTGRLASLAFDALAGGTRLLQYRNKAASAALKLEQARALRTLCARHGATFIVNDDVELAREVDADGVHIGREDPSFETARAALGSGKLVGVSCYRSIENAREAQAAGADYVAFGSFFPSRVKPGAVRAPIELLTQAKRELEVPVVAIGGITPGNAHALVEAGADALAVISALFDAADVKAEAAAFSASFEPRDGAQR